MNQVVHLARFGNRAGAHTLLTHTGAPADLVGQIIWHTDAPPHSSDAVVDRFVAGYRIGDVYVVQFTQPDDTASRSGMVSTTAAMVPASLVAEIDLSALLAQLADRRIDLSLPLSPAPSRERHVHPPGAAALGSAILRGGRVAWIGPGHGDAVSCLWRHASVGDRMRMVFGAAFHPEAIPVPTNSDSIIVISIPSRALSRWSDWQIVSADNPASVDLARDALFGDDRGRASDLARDLGISEIKLTNWRYLAIAADLLESINSLDHESTRSLLQLLGLLQPSPREGVAPKLRALSRLTEVTPAASFADIRGLRGIPWNAFTSEFSLGVLLHLWAPHTDSDTFRSGDFVEAAADVASVDPSDEFAAALNLGLQGAVSRLSVRAAIDAILGHPRGADALSWLVEYGPPPAAVDIELATAVAEVPVIPGWVANSAAHHKLPRTHAVSVDVAESVNAWRAQIEIGVPLEEAEDILAGRIGEARMVRLAIDVPDAQLVDRAGRMIARNPSLLAKGNAEDAGFFNVWSAAVRHGADPWRFVSLTPTAALLLSRVADGGEVDAVLLDALSQTYAADVSRHPQRAKLWDRLPPGSINRFKTATAAALARSFRRGDPIPELELQHAILTTDVMGALAHDDAGQAVVVLGGLSAARSEHAALVAHRGRFSSESGTELARLVLERRWKSAAETITDLAASRVDLRIAATQVGQLLSPLERFRRLMGISGGLHGYTTSDDFRDVVHDVAALLYPEGPASGSLWERAGGRDADLLEAPTGRLRWGAALHAVGRGQRGAPKMKTLLREMLADYPNNEDLRMIVASLEKRKKK